MYSFPVWRRAPFIAVLLIILVIAYAPATTQGTATLRLATLSASSGISHIFVKVSTVVLHVEGLPNSTGWTTLSQSFPVIDLLSRVNQTLSQTIGSGTIHSGRYDAVRVLFTNATMVIDGARTSLSAPSPLNLNATMLVYPNGISDLLVVVAFDYTTLFAATPSLTFIVVRELSV
jgi:Domain of unknown function (DUF4382)